MAPCNLPDGKQQIQLVRNGIHRPVHNEPHCQYYPKGESEATYTIERIGGLNGMSSGVIQHVFELIDPLSSFDGVPACGNAIAGVRL